MKKALLASVLLAGCGGTATTKCTALFAFGLSVEVMSASTGAPICNATVTITDGTYQETATPFQTSTPDGGVSCIYPGAGERAGTYRVDAKSGSSEKAVDGIVVTKDQCHVQPQSVTIAL